MWGTFPTCQGKQARWKRAPQSFRTLSGREGRPVRQDQTAGEEDEPVVVCGAGAAGLAAALAAARAGAAVCLLEARPDLGGTVTHALIHTLGGLYDSGGEFLNGGLARELAQALMQADPSVCRRRLGRAWVLNVCPDLYRAVVRGWLGAELRITVCCSTRVSGVVREADRVVEVEAVGPRGNFRVQARAIVDATG